MKRLVLLFLLLCVAVAPALAKEVVVIETSKGEIKVELDDVKAPISLKNFLSYVDQGYYKETIFHRFSKLYEVAEVVVASLRKLVGFLQLCGSKLA